MIEEIEFKDHGASTVLLPRTEFLLQLTVEDEKASHSQRAD